MGGEIIRFIYVIAMRDATLRGAYKGERTELTDINKFKKIKTEFSDFLGKIVSGEFESREDYNKEFLELAHTVTDEINGYAGNSEFTFGNAQKLINMAVKYLYICSIGDEEKKECFKYCHCPMDSIMLKQVWNSRGNLSEKVQSDLGRAADFTKSWGNEDFEKKGFPERYLKFQEAVRELAEDEDCNPLEYDYRHWQAEKDADGQNRSSKK